MLDVMPTWADSSVHLLIADTPYYKVKALDWDRQWRTVAEYMAWLDRCAEQWQRVLAPNGSLYVFAAPQSREGCTMAARVEYKLAERFNVVNSIVWQKANGNRNWSADKTIWRSFGANSERIIFAEHYGADGYAKGEAGYSAKCDELRGFVFEPLRAYLDGERERAELTTRQVAEAFQQRTGSRTVTGMAGHWFAQVQWALPTAENYQWLRDTFSTLNHGGDYLRREYEDLRREYEDLRRPFSVSADVPYTDVWTFPTVASYPGKHPCEKPLDLLRHIVRASSRPGDTVCDPCCGSGASGVAAVMEGRDYIGCDISEHWANVARKNVAECQAQPALWQEGAS